MDWMRATLWAGAVGVGCGADGVPEQPPLSAVLAPLIQPATTAVIAHRGGRTAAPEETRETLERSVVLGADVLELDLRMTADGVVVCLHDAELDRTTDGSGPVAALDWDALQRLDAGHRFSTDGGQRFPFRGQGVRVPSLAEALRAAPEHPFILEVKQSDPPMVDAVMDVLRDENALDRVILAAFSADTLGAVRAHRDAPATSLAVSEVGAWLWSDPGEMVAPGRFLHLPPEVGPVDLVDRALLERAEQEGLGVQVWTISEEAEMVRLIELGVHGIMTTDPARLRTVVDRLSPPGSTAGAQPGER